MEDRLLVGGLRSGDTYGYIFPYFLMPSGLADLWGLQTIAGLPPEPWLSLTIIIVSFVPVFLLEAQEGRMFRPLAFTKTFAMVGASILSITLVPVLMTIFIVGVVLVVFDAARRWYQVLHGAPVPQEAFGPPLTVTGEVKMGCC